MNDDEYLWDLPTEVRALDEAGRWLVAAYGGRVSQVELGLEGYHYFGRCRFLWGVRVLSIRGGLVDSNKVKTPADAFADVQIITEFMLSRVLLPGIRFSHEYRDTQEHAYTLSRFADLTAHERLALVAKYGTLEAHLRSHAFAAGGQRTATGPC